LDDANVTSKRIHQVRLSPNDARPAEIIEDLVDGIVADGVKEVLAIHKVTQCTSDQTEVGIGGLIGSVFPRRHSGLSPHPTMFNEMTLICEVSIKQEGNSASIAGCPTSLILRSGFPPPPQMYTPERTLPFDYG
jgi:hypothetical protein